jgi:hypothetical protein
VQISGPFPPGNTLVNIGGEIPQTSGTVEISQIFPAPVNEFALIVQKVGNTAVSSPHLAQQREVAQEGEVYIAGAGTAVPAGQPLVVTVTNMPHHSTVPRWTALAISLGILIAGIVAAARPHNPAATRGAERKRLLARRDKLMNELVRLERDQAGGHAARRAELVAALEHIYGALDSDDTPGPGNTAGVAA